jgi:hypothetical protein
MVFKKVKEINRGLCKDFCDIAGKSGDYGKAWIFAILLDIMVPIASFFVGITFFIGGVISGIIPAIGGILLGIVGIIVFLIIIAAYLILSYMEFREIGGLILLPIGMMGIVIVLSMVPLVNIIAFIMSLIPWNIVAVFVHMLSYNKLGKK